MRIEPNRASIWFARTAVATFFAAWLFSFAFYSLGALQPDSAGGRTFPVQMHGTLYVKPWEGEAFYGGLLVSALLFVVAVALDRKSK